MTIARLLFLPAVLLAFASAAFADDVILYSNIPDPLPVNLPSQPYEAHGTSEFGGLIAFAGGGSTVALLDATVYLSDQSYLANWATAVNGTTITTSGYTLPLTLNLYSVVSGDTVGGLIATETIENAFIPGVLIRRRAAAMASWPRTGSAIAVC